MMYCVISVVILLCHYASTAPAGKVLIIHQTCGSSHDVVFGHVVTSLSKIGYQVTQLRTKTEDLVEYSPNYPADVITLPLNTTIVPSQYVNDGVLNIRKDILWSRRRRYWNIPIDSMNVIRVHCHTILGNPDIIEQLDLSGFTVALVDIITNECGLALANHLKIPALGFWGFAPMGAEANLIRGFLPPSLAVDMMSEVGTLMTLFSRAWNSFTWFLDYALTLVLLESTDSIIQQYLPGIPHPWDLLMDVNVILANSHPIMEYPTFQPPHLVSIGCLSCKDSQPLDKEMKEFARPGVVLFSLGLSGFSSKVIPRTFIQTVLKSFSLLPYNVIFRFNMSYIEDEIPKNVLVQDFVPQNDLLGSGRVVAFITHCGMKSAMEAIYHGVPMVGMPIFADQGDNAQRILERGIGLILDKSTMTVKQLTDSILTVAREPRFKESINRLSEIMRMEREDPMNKIIHWIKMVEKFGNLSHLKANTRNLYIFQQLLYDVIFVFIGLLVCIILLCYYCFKFLRKQQKPESSKNKEENKKEK